MKIAILHPILDSVGGAELIVTGLARELSLKMHKVTIFVNYFARDLWKDRIPAEVKVVELFHSKSDNGEDILPADWIRAGWKLQKALKDFDLINAHNFPTLIWAYFAKRFNPSLPPVVWFCHEPLRLLYRNIMDTHHITHRPIYNILESWNELSSYEQARELMNIYRMPKEVVARYFDNKAVQAADTILANSEYTLSFVKEIYGKSGKTVHVGIPFSAKNIYKIKKGATDNYILSVSRIVPLKNFRTVIQAFEYIKKSQGARFKDLRLKIAGTGYPEMDHLKEQSILSGVSSYVDFMGFVPDRELDKLYTDASCMMILPFEEPFGLVYLEAMSRGIPVIASNEGGAKEFIKDGINGILVDPKDYRSAAEKCIKLLSNKNFIRFIGDNGYLTVRGKYTLKHFADRFEKGIASIL